MTNWRFPATRASAPTTTVAWLTLAAGLLMASGCAAAPLTETAAAAPAQSVQATESTQATTAAIMTELPGLEAPTPAGQSEVKITLDNGRSFSLIATDCSYQPGAQSPAPVMVMSGYGEGSVELNAMEMWPFDGTTDNGTLFVNSFVDEQGQAFVLDKPASVDTSNGGVTFITTMKRVASVVEERPISGVFSCR